MSIASFKERSEQRRTANADRRLLLAADRVAGQIGTLTTRPRTPQRSREFDRLSRLLDDIDIEILSDYLKKRLAELS